VGRYALEHGDYPAVRHERRRFRFLHGSPPDQGACFLLATDVPGTPCPMPLDWNLDPALLQACVLQSTDWKERQGFPLDVEEVLGPDATSESASALPAPPDWHRVIVDRAEHLPALLVRPGGTDSGLLGFAVRTDGWVLQADRPAFRLDADAPEVFPEIREEPSLEAWRQAWRAWCQPRHLPQSEVEAVSLEHAGHQLRVLAEKRLLDRLRAARSEALQGEAWLLAGSGRIRLAAKLELAERQ
jgi:hypothetical protein